VRSLAVVALSLVLVAAAAGCGGGDERAASSSPAKAVGEERAGSTVQFASCRDWRGGSRAERVATVVALRGQMTPQRSASAASPLPDERALELLDKTCAVETSASLRLYKLYVRMQGFAPLSQ
jgi:hypothetical protein